jgi:hypothetical protein
MLVPELAVPSLDTGGMIDTRVANKRRELPEAIGRRATAAAQLLSRKTA